MQGTQHTFWDGDEPRGRPTGRRSSEQSTTFIDNTRLPVHRWFRFSAGFSAVWVAELLAKQKSERDTVRVLDPFAGSGTAMLEADKAGVQSRGLEAQPFICRTAQAKLLWHTSAKEFEELAEKALANARQTKGSVAQYPSLVRKCFPDHVLEELDRLRRSIYTLRDDSAAWRLTWLALVASLRGAAPVDTAQWTYVLPRKRKAPKPPPRVVFREQIGRMADDMHVARKQGWTSCATVTRADARTCEGVPESWATTVITSPPYANNYDYADASRLELCFLGEIRGWCDLQSRVRRDLVRSCSQHVAAEKARLVTLLDDDALAPVRDEVAPICTKLASERENHGGKKHYHTMVAAYFCDLARVWRALRRACADGASVCFVIGDSAPYGVHVPVERLLGELAVANGFHSFRFEKVRDRNVKWKNRKHRIPLQEGRLWVQG